MLIKSKISYKSNIIAIVNIFSSSNNTIINISNIYNKTLLCGSAGLFEMKGSCRSTSYAAQLLGNTFGKRLIFLGAKYGYIKIKGFGNGRYSSIKSLSSLKKFKILKILDLTPLPFNGCKPPKRRRV